MPFVGIRLARAFARHSFLFCLSLTRIPRFLPISFSTSFASVALFTLSEVVFRAALSNRSPYHEACSPLKKESRVGLTVVLSLFRTRQSVSDQAKSNSQ